MKDSTKKINYESAQAVKEYLRSDRSGSLYTFTSFFIQKREEFATASHVVSVERTLIWY